MFEWGIFLGSVTFGGNWKNVVQNFELKVFNSPQKITLLQKIPYSNIPIMILLQKIPYPNISQILNNDIEINYSHFLKLKF